MRVSAAPRGRVETTLPDRAYDSSAASRIAAVAGLLIPADCEDAAGRRPPRRRPRLVTEREAPLLGMTMLITWMLGVNVLVYRLRRYLVDPHKTECFGLFPRPVYIVDLFRPSLFHPEGQRLRLLTAASFTVGLVVLLITTVF